MANAVRLLMTARADQAKAELRSVAAGTKKVGDSASTASKKTIAWGAAIVGATAALGAMYAVIQRGSRFLLETIDQTTEYGDAIAKMARVTGTSAEALQGFQFAATRGGATVEQLNQGLKKLSRSMGDSNRGLITQKEVFDRLGVAVADADGKLRKTEDVFRDLADAVKAQGLGAQTTADLMTVLGRSGAELGNMMAGGADGLDEMQERLVELGGVMSGEGLLASEIYRDSISDLDVAVDGLRRRIGEDLLPTAIGATGTLTEMTAALNAWLDSGDRSFANAAQNARNLAEALPAASGLFNAYAAGFQLLAGAESKGEKIIRDATKAARADREEREGLQAALLAEMEARHAASAAAREQTRLERAAAREAEALERSLDRLAQRYKALGETDGQRFNRQVLELNSLLAVGKLTADEYTAALQQLADAYNGVGEAVESEVTPAIQEADNAQRVFGDSLSAVGDLSRAVSDLVVQLYGEQSQEAKEAAKTMFVVQQAAALAQATVNLAAAISEANASAPPPYNIPAIVGAGIVGGAQIATIAATTIAGIADAGMLPGALRDAGLNEHSLIIKNDREMVLDPIGTGAISEQIRLTNAILAGGGSVGGGDMVAQPINIQLDGDVLYRSVEHRRVRAAERGLDASRARRY